MIISFWIAALALCAIAVAFILWPLYRGRQDAAVEDRTRINVDIYEERLAELDASLAAGEIDATEFEVLKAELQKNLLEDTGGQEGGQPAASGIGRLPIVFAVLVPLFAMFAYSEYGLSWGSIADVELAGELDQKGPHSQSSMAENVKHLAERLKDQPENDEGWFLLAQSYMNLEQYEEAAGTFRHLLGRYPEDYNLSGYYTQAIYLADGRVVTPRVDASIKKTLALNPHDISMLEILAMDAFSKGNYNTTLDYFRQALQAGPEEDRAKAINQAIAGVEKIMRDQGLEVPQPEVAAAPGAPAAAPTGRTLSVLVEVADSVAVDEDASVFVYARAIGGPPMPLAVKRMSRDALPGLVKLDESMGMMEGMSLANFDSVEVIARISSSGIANASPDDYEARSAPIDLASGPSEVIKLKIEHRRKEL